MPPLKLHTYYRSSCSARLRIALHLKSIPFTSHALDLLKNQHLSPAYRALNPSSSVPTLEIPGPPPQPITQSLAALEYLEEAYPAHPPLLPPPSDPLARATARALAGIIACDVQPVTNLRVLRGVKRLGGAPEDWAREYTERGLGAYERLVEASAGRFSVGDGVSLADVCLVPAVWNARRWGVEMGAWPTVRRVVDEMERLEGVRWAHWGRQGDTPAGERMGDEEGGA